MSAPEAFTLRGLWLALTPADRAVCALLLVISLLGAGWSRWQAVGAREAIVTVDRRDVRTIPLAQDGTHSFPARLGPVTLEVRDGAIRAVDAPCPHRLCVAMGEKRAAGEIIACVPSGLVVRLTGGRADPDAPDGVSR